MWAKLFGIKRKVDGPEFVIGGRINDDFYTEYVTYYRVYLLPYKKDLSIPVTWDDRREELILGVREEFCELYPQVFNEKVEVDQKELNEDKEFWQIFNDLEQELKNG